MAEVVETTTGKVNETICEYLHKNTVDLRSATPPVSPFLLRGEGGGGLFVTSISPLTTSPHVTPSVHVFTGNFLREPESVTPQNTPRLPRTR